MGGLGRPGLRGNAEPAKCGHAIAMGGVFTSWDAPSQEGRPEARRASNMEQSKVGLETVMVMTNENSTNCGGKREMEDNRDRSQSVWVSGCR